jgi:uncharacterized NAD(P)/FAD-binding protein YdhS
MPAPRTHAVIGDGATAAQFAITAPVRAGDRLLLIGPDVAQLGRGLAYRAHPAGAPWRYAYLLNSPNEMVHPDFTPWVAAHWPRIEASMRAHQPRWLDTNADAVAARDYGALFAPRAFFGDWVRHRVAEGLSMLSNRGVQVEMITAAVTGLTASAAGLRLTLASGGTLTADSIDLATGGAETCAFGTTAAPGLAPQLYGHEALIAKALQPGAPVTCLGGNAAMLDVLRLLQSLLPEDAIRLRVIRRGAGPEPLHLDRPRRPPVQPDPPATFETAEAFFASLDAQIATYRAAGAEMAQIRSGVSRWFDSFDLNAILPDRAEQRHLQVGLEPRFRRGTSDSIADFDRLHTAGQIEILQGCVEAVTPAAPSGAIVTYRAAGRTGQLHAPLVINTSGPRDPLALDPLARRLLGDGILRANPDRTGLILRDGLRTELDGLRYLSPVVTEIGDRVLPFPLYDVARLWAEVDRANGA